MAITGTEISATAITGIDDTTIAQYRDFFGPAEEADAITTELDPNEDACPPPRAFTMVVSPVSIANKFGLTE